MTIGLELHKNGTVRFAESAFHSYGIVGDDGSYYDPIHPLGLSYQVDGLRVSFVATTREDYTSEWGIAMEIISIQGLEEAAPEEVMPIIPDIPTAITPTEVYKSPWVWVVVGIGILLLRRRR